MPRQAVSNVWNYFIKCNGGGECKICGKQVKSCGNTTNLANHLHRKHPLIKKTESSSGISGSSSAIMIEQDINFLENEDSIEIDGTASGRSTPTSSVSSLTNCTFSQKRITDTFGEIGSFKEGGTKHSQIINEILFMIVKDNLPLSTTEKPGFQHFIKRALPHYKIPARKTITNLLDNKYDILRRLMIDDLFLVKNISITADVWTDTTNNTSFLGATAHFIKNGKFCNIVLCLEELHEKHTSELLQDKLLHVFNEWNIEISKIAALITDNGANIVKASEQVVEKHKHLPCFAHTLNLVAEKTCSIEF
ncbi:hypothetical protein ABEB36_000430 [Hypothenemus hampei]|uniref:BED-type domain-containing protein n=1 Tax=Hypothenemus hampei TaxID=57062 RepID=A0ABD1FB83_HYPHA